MLRLMTRSSVRSSPSRITFAGRRPVPAGRRLFGRWLVATGLSFILVIGSAGSTAEVPAGSNIDRRARIPPPDLGRVTEIGYRARDVRGASLAQRPAWIQVADAPLFRPTDDKQREPAIVPDRFRPEPGVDPSRRRGDGGADSPTRNRRPDPAASDRRFRPLQERPRYEELYPGPDESPPPPPYWW